MQDQARKNLKLLFIVKIFTKRVFFPIVPIYLMTHMGFSIQEIGLVSVLFSIVTITSNVPAGYFADKFGRANSMRAMALLQIVATLTFFFATTKEIIYVAFAIEALGYSLYIGALEALIHDSVQVTKQEKLYTKIMARAQSFALLVNAGLVALIPMTYAINPRLPFLFGTLAFATLFITTLRMGEVLPLAKHKPTPRKFDIQSLLLLRKNILLVVFVILLGTVGALYYSFDIFTIALKQYGMQPEFVGWVFAGASLLGAAVGPIIHHLKRLPVSVYMVFDATVLVLPFIAIFTTNLPAIIASMMLFMAFWRYRKIVYQQVAFERYSTRYKATLISALFMAEDIQGLWVPIALTSAIAAYGMSTAMGYSAVVIVLLTIPFAILGHAAFGRRR